MKLYIDKNDVIIDVGTTDDASLMEVTIDDEKIKGWSEAKLCCYAVYRDETKVTGLYPVVSTKLIKRIDKLGQKNQVQDNDINENSEAVCDIADLGQENADAITDMADYVNSLEERIEALEGGNENG